MILPRDRQIQVVDKSYIDSLIERKNPELMQNVMPVMDYSNNLNTQEEYEDTKLKYNTVSPESAGIKVNSSITETSERNTTYDNSNQDKTSIQL